MPPSHRPPHPPHGPPRHGHPHGPHTGGPERRASVPASRALGFIDTAALDAALAPLVPDAGDRDFVARCVVGEGPIHHRGANFVLVMLLSRAVTATARAAPAPVDAAETVPVPMRLPPHLADTVEDGNYPIALPTAALRDLAGGDAGRLEAMVDCLTDGPPQHALANVVIVALLDRLLAARRD